MVQSSPWVKQKTRLGTSVGGLVDSIVSSSVGVAIEGSVDASVVGSVGSSVEDVSAGEVSSEGVAGVACWAAPGCPSGLVEPPRSGKRGKGRCRSRPPPWSRGAGNYHTCSDPLGAPKFWLPRPTPPSPPRSALASSH